MTRQPALLIGYGNPGRGDDGLGPAFAERIAAQQLPELSVDIDFQLTVDHAGIIAGHDLVIFADALIGCDAPFRFQQLTDSTPQGMGSHSVTPEAAISLAHLLFQASPQAFVLGITGAQFGKIEEGLSPRAQDNLQLAEEHFLFWYANHRQHQPV